MNNRGQFSIIAALLITIILISTVMLTYTEILNNSIQVQPQVLTAIDETNFAIKQLLGFSVGYYGSVIRVTGDTSFANQSTLNYTTSGLEYVANTHADWGAGFSLTNLTVDTYWFNNFSYSTGYLDVTYNLTKLGIYGVQYAPSCGLTVQIANTTQNNQTSLIVTEDQNEPVIDLGEQNFQFFQYVIANSTWALVSPSTGPVAYTNGTYQIQPPAGIDANSYVVQVTDQRGIIVVASPSSSYMVNLTWPSASLTTLYAHQETKQINGTNYYSLLSTSADNSGLTLNASMSAQRTLFAQFVYPLQGVSTIPASTWTMYYRAWEDAATINIDAVGHGNNGNGGSSISWSHTTGSGSNRIMIVGISIRSASVKVSSIAYGSQNLTYIRGDSSSNQAHSELWYLIAPASGTQTVTVTLSGSAKATGGSCTYTGVAQTSPIDANNGGSAASSSPSQSLIVNTANSLLLGNVAVASTSTTVQSEGSGQTPRWDEKAGSSSAARGHGSDKGPVGTGNQSMFWTLSQSADWAVSIVAIKPATLTAGYADVNILIRKSDGSIRTTIATAVAASGNLPTTPTTLLGNYLWPAYNVTSQTDYIEIDYYVNVTNAGSLNAHLVIDNQTLAIGDQTRVTGLNLPSLLSSSAPNIITIELLQNGTMRWLGQSLNLTTQAMPIPPLPTKSIHVNQTINGVDSEVPFQIEDWASDYLIPLGLTSNSSVFNAGNMIVFLVNNNVSRVTIWWNGSDLATQTSLAYNDKYFTKDDTANGILSNGNLTLLFPTVQLYVDGFNSTFTNWKTNGTSPYLNGAQNNYIFDNKNNDNEGWFTFQDLPTTYSQLFGSQDQGIGASVSIDFDCYSAGDDYFNFSISNGKTTYGPYTINPPTPPTNTQPNWVSYDISSIVNTLRSVNNAIVKLTYVQVGPTASYINITGCRLSLNFWLTSICGNSTASADFMRINTDASIYGASPAYIISNGVVRDIVQQEAEWSNGPTNCPNVYSHIVLTLPANATYYTYELRALFVQSQQSRNITDLCPIEIQSSITQAQTENGTANGYPIVSNLTGTFYNQSTIWAHHWSQISSGANGAGIMFTDAGNNELYCFDNLAGTQTGGLRVNSAAGTIELLPVETVPVNFTYALNTIWCGAVSTFSNTTPIYQTANGQISGSWISIEYPPTAATYTGP